MAKQIEKTFGLNPETIVELITIKGEKVNLNLMKYSEALEILKKKKAGWIYIVYQKGFSQFSNITKK